MIKRVYSLETEYALAFASSRAKALATEQAKGDLYDRLEAHILGRGAYAMCDPTRHRSRRVDDDLVRVREGYFLGSGARLYYDAGHLEWAAPETSDPYQALVYDRAGELELAAALAAVQSQGIDSHPLIIKNNLDYQSGVTYGCHENYSVQRYSTGGKDVMAQVVGRLVPFLVTRQILCGAGRLGAARPPYVAFQLAQRADFTTVLSSEDTRENRPIVNLRDEPLADTRRYTRLHLILGDSNMAEYPSFLKLGMAGILLDMIEADADLPNLTLEVPQTALHQVSRDLGFSCRLPLKGGGTDTALGIQQVYLQAAWDFVNGQDNPDPMAYQILERWDGLLLAIHRRVAELEYCLDWAIKRRILGESLKQAGASWGELELWEAVLAHTWTLSVPQARPLGGWSRWLKRQLQESQWRTIEAHCQGHKLDLKDYGRYRRIAADLRALDIRYHEINPQQGWAYQPSQAAPLIGQTFGNSADLELARREAPADTRAAIRGCAIRLATERDGIACMDWDRIHLTKSNQCISLPDPLSNDVSVLEGLLGPEASCCQPEDRTPLPLAVGQEEEDQWGISILRVDEMPDSEKSGA